MGMILQYFHPHSFSQETIARLGGIGAAAVELIINCANVARRMELGKFLKILWMIALETIGRSWDITG